MAIWRQWYNVKGVICSDGPTDNHHLGFTKHYSKFQHIVLAVHNYFTYYFGSLSPISKAHIWQAAVFSEKALKPLCTPAAQCQTADRNS